MKEMLKKSHIFMIFGKIKPSRKSLNEAWGNREKPASFYGMTGSISNSFWTCFTWKLFIEQGKTHH